MSRPQVLLLDHRDSFVFLLADQIARLGADVDVVRASLPIAQWQRLLDVRRPALVVLSPGPGHPESATLALEWLAVERRRAGARQPVLGVCLGHQILGLAAGARIARGPAPAHGEAIEIEWCDVPLATELPRRMPVGRYHSLVVEDVVAPLRVLATAHTGGRDVVMAIEHAEQPWLGLQFHPESVLTPHGSALLRAVLARATAIQSASTASETKR